MLRVQLLPEYGYWKDMFGPLLSGASGVDDCTVAAAARACSEQFRKDRSALEAATARSERPEISLLAKYFPRQSRLRTRKAKTDAEKAAAEAVKRIRNLVARDLFGPTEARPKTRLRKEYFAPLNRALQTPEMLMSTGHWRDIDFRKVPSLCAARHRDAFLNKRKVSDPDRVAAKDNFLNAAKRGKLKAAQLAPHELVAAALDTADPPDAEQRIVLDAQWKAFVKDYRRRLAKATGVGPKPVSSEKVGVDSDSDAAAAVDAAEVDAVDAAAPKQEASDGICWLPLVDVSGCSTRPQFVAMAFGLLLAECAAEPFRDTVLTFNTGATVHRFLAEDGFCERVRKFKQLLGQNCDTNLEQAMNLLLDSLVASKLGAAEHPRVLVFSDMDFEEGNCYDSAELGGWSAAYGRVQERFAEAGARSADASPWAVPPVTFWCVASKLLTSGDSYDLPRDAQQLELFLGSTTRNILCGACMGYAGSKFLGTISFNQRGRAGDAMGGAVKHSGDTFNAMQQSEHKLEIDLAALPPSVDTLYFTLCACGGSNLASYKDPQIRLEQRGRGSSGFNLCKYVLPQDAGCCSAFMCRLMRKSKSSNRWVLTAGGGRHQQRCCSNYAIMQQLVKDDNMLDYRVDSAPAPPLPVDTPGISMLAGFSPDLLWTLIADEVEVAAEEAELLKAAGCAEQAAAVSAKSVAAKRTPVEVLQRSLRKPRLQPVWDLLRQSQEGLLANLRA